MSCNDYIIWISGHIDGTNSKKDEQQLQAHLAGCPHCRKVLEAMKANESVLKEENLTPPPEISRKVMAAVRKDAAARKKSRFRNYFVSVAAAAAVLCLVLLSSLRVPEVPTTGPDSGSPDTATEAVMPVAEEPETKDSKGIMEVTTESTYSTKSRSQERSSPCHCVFIELPSVDDMPAGLPPMIREDMLSRIPREAVDHYFYGGSIVYGEAEMSYEELAQWEAQISFRFLHETVETDRYIVVFCSQSR